MKMLQVVFFAFLLATSFACNIQRKEVPYKTESYVSRMAEFEKEHIPQGRIIFLGNSLTQAGKWSEYFPIEQPINRGISGDNTYGMYARIGDITKVKPSKLFILTGINDISQNVSTDDILFNIIRITARVKKESPSTIIYIQSILPINNSFGRYKRLIGKESQVLEYNQALESFCKKENLTFINLFPLYADESNSLIPAYTYDGLHLKPEAYQVWVKAIQKYIN